MSKVLMRKHLEDVDGVNVGVAHLNQPPQRGIVLAQMLVPCDLHTIPDCSALAFC